MKNKAQTGLICPKTGVKTFPLNQHTTQNIILRIATENTPR